MQRRTLGRSKLQVSQLCFGGNVFGWTADERTSHQLLDAFIEAGGNFIDTADVYSKWAPGNQGGESETVIGNWLKQRGGRDQVIIATKVGMEMAPNRKGLSKQHILKSVDESLTRLQTDYIDLYQSHIDDEHTLLEETLSAYQTLIEQGKIRVIGASNYSAQRLQEALELSKQGLPRYESLQPKYNLYDRQEFETSLQPVTDQNEVGVISYYALAAGFLTGKYRAEADLQNRARARSVQRYLDERGQTILKALDQVANETGATQAQIAIAWLLAKPSITSPIVSATKLDQLHQITQATQLKLEPSQIEQLDQASTY